MPQLLEALLQDDVPLAVDMALQQLQQLQQLQSSPQLSVLAIATRAILSALSAAASATQPEPDWLQHDFSSGSGGAVPVPLRVQRAASQAVRDPQTCADVQKVVSETIRLCALPQLSPLLPSHAKLLGQALQAHMELQYLQVDMQQQSAHALPHMLAIGYAALANMQIPAVAACLHFLLNTFEAHVQEQVQLASFALDTLLVPWAGPVHRLDGVATAASVSAAAAVGAVQEWRTQAQRPTSHRCMHSQQQQQQQDQNQDQEQQQVAQRVHLLQTRYEAIVHEWDLINLIPQVAVLDLAPSWSQVDITDSPLQLACILLLRLDTANLAAAPLASRVRRLASRVGRVGSTDRAIAEAAAATHLSKACYGSSSQQVEELVADLRDAGDSIDSATAAANSDELVRAILRFDVTATQLQSLLQQLPPNCRLPASVLTSLTGIAAAGCLQEFEACASIHLLPDVQCPQPAELTQLLATCHTAWHEGLAQAALCTVRKLSEAGVLQQDQAVPGWQHPLQLDAPHSMQQLLNLMVCVADDLTRLARPDAPAPVLEDEQAHFEFATELMVCLLGLLRSCLAKPGCRALLTQHGLQLPHALLSSRILQIPQVGHDVRQLFADLLFTAEGRQVYDLVALNSTIRSSMVALAQAGSNHCSHVAGSLGEQQQRLVQQLQDQEQTSSIAARTYLQMLQHTQHEHQQTAKQLRACRGEAAATKAQLEAAQQQVSKLQQQLAGQHAAAATQLERARAERLQLQEQLRSLAVQPVRDPVRQQSTEAWRDLQQQLDDSTEAQRDLQQQLEACEAARQAREEQCTMLLTRLQSIKNLVMRRGDDA
jgi:hypothetical protein